jgi:hypothetical protein
MPRSPALQPGDQVIIQITHMQISAHPACRDLIALNDLTSSRLGQQCVWQPSTASGLLCQ